MSYITTYTGRRFYYDNITKDSIYIPDVLHALPRINRFVGHSSRPYSVAEHTFIGLAMAEKLGYTTLQKIHWCTHDFPEAYSNDCPAPLKRMLPEYSRIEGQIEKALFEHLGLKPMTDEEYYLMKRIDMTMLVLEMRDLTLHTHESFIDEHTYLDILDDDEFIIGQKPLGDSLLTEILTETFNNLMEEYRNGNEKV